MYTEVIRILEAALVKDIKKVNSYAKLLADKLTKDGDVNMAKMVLRALSNGPAHTVTMDELLTAPVDQESRLKMVDFSMPNEDLHTIILPSLVKEQVVDFVHLVQNQAELNRRGVEISRSLLLCGKPGCGKTTLAQYISRETGLPLVTARLDAIVSSLLGNTAKNLRKIFDFADSKPCILFLDEFDAIAKARDDQYELGELKRVINSLLQNMDAFVKNNILIAATNHPELLDKAIWRRFNTVIEIDLPQEEERAKLVEVFTNGFETDFSQDEKKIEKIVRLLEGTSPSDIKTIINNTKAKTIISHKDKLGYEDLLVELFEFKKQGNITPDKLAEYLNENGIPQADIAERLNISVRQVRNYLNKN